MDVALDRLERALEELGQALLDSQTWLEQTQKDPLAPAPDFKNGHLAWQGLQHAEQALRDARVLLLTWHAPSM